MQQSGAQSYAHFLAGIKERIRTAQVKAALAANAELVLHYWEVGRDILANQARQGSVILSMSVGFLSRSNPPLFSFPSFG